MARVLITGVAGFAGYHLVNLLRHEHELFGFDHKLKADIQYLEPANYRQMNINDKQAVVD
ncbi:MAG TPA: NAD-dependent epimerase/dehydratase family protein, partial [Actinobacteria bacterium]|nr:NAD-dependent epimerase/dehydratase family protein [Actinomycetes bacterium]HEX21482.1 NAD-dependent epimerase/dehydratase family protein [Actinomycetota bacterium]